MKVDFKKEFKNLYQPLTREVTLVDVPPMNFLMVDGRGDPNTSEPYMEAIKALYGVSFTLKFMLKTADDLDYSVMPLEGLWWVEDMSRFTMENKDTWQWTAMIMQPIFVTDALFETAREQVRKKEDSASLREMRLAALHEGLAAQIMHIGPYAAEAPTIEKVLSFIKENGYQPNGKHHEIYLSDPRRSKPESMKTVIRQPVKIAGA